MNLNDNPSPYVRKDNDNGSDASNLTKNSVQLMPHSEDELDLTDGSKQGSVSDKISTFTEIAARVGKDLHEKGYKNSELDWLELETKMREMLSEQLQIVFKTFDK